VTPNLAIVETAYAKINLALHVRARRDDGYHELETLFAFVDSGDIITARSGERDRLTSVGEFAQALDNPFDNLVMRALNALPRPQGLDVTLEKNLPVAAGLGGGSADAGALFRIVEKAHGLPDDWRIRAERLGADVPSCVRSEMAIGRGIGSDLEPVENDLAGMPVLLVNPRIPLPTAPVFKAWEGKDGGALPTGTARDIALAGRNDLRAPAIAICPSIGDILTELDRDTPILAEMSGSGATCFALYESAEMRDKAADRINALRQGWWLMKGSLR
jgi:4-diphosphocytidyl-2-C-methyl-D-erythritol kinase